MTLTLVRHQFTVKQDHQIADAGILTENDRVELIRGEMINMSPIIPKHSGCVIFLTNLLVLILQKLAIGSVHNPVILNEISEPQPDI
jgi:Uma2 family endonuclease